jgi:hypothetical protein
MYATCLGPRRRFASSISRSSWNAFRYSHKTRSLGSFLPQEPLESLVRAQLFDVRQGSSLRRSSAARAPPLSPHPSRPRSAGGFQALRRADGSLPASASSPSLAAGPRTLLRRHRRPSLRSCTAASPSCVACSLQNICIMHKQAPSRARPTFRARVTARDGDVSAEPSLSRGPMRPLRLPYHANTGANRSSDSGVGAGEPSRPRKEPRIALPGRNDLPARGHAPETTSANRENSRGACLARK